MIYIAYPAANYHGNRKHTLELVHFQHVLCPLLCFYKNDLYLESRHKKTAGQECRWAAPFRFFIRCVARPA